MNNIPVLDKLEDALVAAIATEQQTRKAQQVHASMPVPVVPARSGLVALRSVRVRVLAGVAAAALLAVGIQAAQVTAPDNSTFAPARAAAVELTRASEAATRSVNETSNGRYLHITTRSLSSALTSPDLDKSIVEYERVTREEWVPRSFSGDWVLRVSTAGQPVQVFRGRDGAYDKDSSRPGSNWIRPDGDVVRTLPRDPAELLRMMYASGDAKGSTQAETALTLATNVLSTGYVPADLRAALFEALASVPGLQVVDDRATLDGRTGVAITATTGDGDRRSEVIFNPASGQLIGSRVVALRADPKAGIAAGQTLTWSSMRVEAVDATP